MATGRRILFVAWAMGCTGLACAQNLIVNGDFEGGNVGFFTDYLYSPGDIWLIGTYDVVYDVSDVHPLAELHHDHTTGAGLMMAANGALPNLPIVWSQTVTVTPGVRYEFSAWAANWAHGSQGHMAPLEFRINGTPVAFWISTVVGQWFLVSANWYTGAATTAVIMIVDLSEEWDGNDPALDDLWLALLGDMNCDGGVDFGDINPFVMALLDPVGYHGQYANCNILNGDINGNGSVDFADINPFVALLSAGSEYGACCYGDDSCAVTTPADCTGTWLGVNTACDPNPCPPTGACCYDDGFCGVTPSAICTGTWLGANTTCVPNPCGPPMGACCLMDGSCIVIKPPGCAAQGGIYQGDSLPCESITCEPFYCSAGAEICDEYIARVQIESIDNPSGCEAGQYADYTALGPATLPIGVPTQCTVTNGNPVYYDDVCSIWIDWNHDFVFDDGGEELIDDVWGVGPYVFNITPPMDTLYGPTRMRIRIDYANYDPDPCGLTYYGEVEDYTVNVMDVLGACCRPDGTCTQDLPSNCGGYWGGPYVPCANGDCNTNGADDFCDIASGASPDCDQNGIPDECQPFIDCNENGVPDFCDIASGTSFDCNENGVPDECDVPPPYGNCEGPDCSEDCEPNGHPDECEPDCDDDGYPDECVIQYCEAAPWCSDCNDNAVPDGCDIADGTSEDCNFNGIPDECELADNDCNNNGIPDDCDIAAGACDCQGDGIPDDCQLHGTPRWPPLQYDDGSSENSLGLTAGGELCWIHHFAAYPGWIGSVQTCFGTPLYPSSSGVSPGDPFRVFLWNDPNGDGNPSDAVFIGEAAGVVDGASIDSDVLQSVWVYLPTSGSFFVGASVVTTSGYPAPMDENGVQYHQSWVAFNQVPFDPNDVTTHLYNMDDIGFTCNWLLRVDGIFPPPSYDCNHNGIPDACDIGVEWGGFCATPGADCFPGECEPDCNANGLPDGCEGDCNGNGRADECDVPPICQGEVCSLDCNADLIPDECQLGWQDCNHNGVPDDCDIAAGTSLDCNSNGKPDECELGYNDCNHNGVPDDCDVASGTSPDCNSNGKPDECDVAAGTSPDCNSNGVPDECDVASGFSPDCNLNAVPDECDVADCDGALWCRDCQGDGIPDGCQLPTGPGAPGRDALLWDDGTSEDAFGLIINAELCWMVHFTAPYPGAVAAVMTCFGTPLYPGNSGVSAGQPFRVFVWSDPNGDGDPHDAVFLGEATGAVNGASIDTDMFQSVLLNVPVSGSFFVGASIVTPAARYPAPMDENGVQYNAAWVAFDTVPFNPHHIHNLFNMAAQGQPCNWLLRAQAFFIPPPNDCNENDIPDECDIGIEWGGYCTRPPNDPAGPCDSDQNGNGIPDGCERCGDLDYDGSVDLDDYWLFLAAFGTCVGQPNYNPTADLDGDGCVTLVDYQAWRMCYKMANGKDFVAPKPKPVPAPAKKAF